MSQRTSQKTKSIGLMTITAFLLFAFMQMTLVSAQSNQFQQILQPIETIYNLVKYAATVIAGLVMVFAGITYISSGSDPQKREQAKNMVMYVIIGLIVIWAAPFVVNLILGTS